MFYPLYSVIRSFPDPCPIFSYWSGFVGAQIWFSASGSMGGRAGALPPNRAHAHSCEDAVNIDSLPPVACTRLIPQDYRETGMHSTLQSLFSSLVK